jgi:hypothetical protein
MNKYRKPHDENESRVFINRYGVPLSPTDVDQLLDDLKEQCGITGVRVSAHTFRHTFARTYLARGGDLGKLSRLMGHSKVSTTEEYLKDFSSRDARADQSEFSPVAGLKAKKSRRGFQKTQRPDLDSM